MEITAIAAWLNRIFAGFDSAAADFAYALHSGSAGGFFDWLFPFLTLFAEAGIFFILLGVGMSLFRRSRQTGFSVLLALIVGLLAANVLLKNSVLRPRPYADELSIFFSRWQEIGHGLEPDIGSFPSGHATAAFAATTALFWNGNKKYSWTAWLLAVGIGFSRIYIYVHFASDVLGGALVGFLSGTAAYLLMRFFFSRCAVSEKPAAVFLHTADVRQLFSKQ